MPAAQGFFGCIFHAASSPFVTQRLPQECGESYSSDPTIFGFSFWALLTFCCSSQSRSSSRRTNSRFPMWNAGKVAYYEKDKIQMTLMTLNLGYGIGISPKQRHKRHQRHYRHARTVPGVWGTPQKCVCGYPNAMLAKHIYPKTIAIKPDSHTYSYKFQSESV